MAEIQSTMVNSEPGQLLMKSSDYFAMQKKEEACLALKLSGIVDCTMSHYNIFA